MRSATGSAPASTAASSPAASGPVAAPPDASRKRRFRALGGRRCAAAVKAVALFFFLTLAIFILDVALGVALGVSLGVTLGVALVRGLCAAQQLAEARPHHDIAAPDIRKAWADHIVTAELRIQH
jgi:hypothetical protein